MGGGLAQVWGTQAVGAWEACPASGCLCSPPGLPGPHFRAQHWGMSQSGRHSGLLPAPGERKLWGPDTEHASCALWSLDLPGPGELPVSSLWPQLGDAAPGGGVSGGGLALGWRIQGWVGQEVEQGGRGVRSRSSDSAQPPQGVL